MTDAELETLSMDIDNVIWLLCKSYGVDPFMMSSVVLARLAVMNRDLNNAEDWNRLLAECIKSTSQEAPKEVVVH